MQNLSAIDVAAGVGSWLAFRKPETFTPEEKVAVQKKTASVVTSAKNDGAGDPLMINNLRAVIRDRGAEPVVKQGQVSNVDPRTAEALLVAQLSTLKDKAPTKMAMGLKDQYEGQSMRARDAGFRMIQLDNFKKMRDSILPVTEDT
jgi:hypothetical protein